jgi:NADH:ubiquinone oxidoreductase subunit D
MALGVVNRGKEVIDGLADHNYIRSIYKTSDMHQSKAIIRDCLHKLHQVIVKFHLQVR